MSKTKELSIQSTQWVEAVEVVELKNVALDKLNVQDCEYDAKYKLKDYVIEYNGGGFWLTISDLKGYFRIINGVGYLDLLFRSDEQGSMNDKIWQTVLNSIGCSDGLVKDSKTIRLYSDELPIDREFFITKLTIVVKSVIEWRNAFYPQISLNYCSYDV